jgi:uncharacterized membrane protein YkvA (DUF1232 family)
MRVLSMIKKLKQMAKKLKTQLVVLFFAYKDPRVPWYAKAFTICVVAYAFSPIDLIPDFIPILGYLDDLIIVPLGIFLALKMIPQDVLDDCSIKAQEKINEKKPKNWLVGGLFILIWITLTAILCTYFYNAYK